MVQGQGLADEANLRPGDSEEESWGLADPYSLGPVCPRMTEESLSFSHCCCDVRGGVYPRSPAFLWEEQLLNDVISSWVAVTLGTCDNT